MDEANQLQSVTDSSLKTTGFNDGNTTGNDFTYDANGNMITDANKGIINISYNHLNLPSQVTFAADKYIDYIYDASGIKLKKIVTDQTAFTETSYAGNYIYEEAAGVEELKFFNQPEGYVEPDGSNGYNYIYQYKDHLGNIRLSYTDANGDGDIDVTTDPNTNEIVEENNYYPFGLRHKGYNNVVNGTHHPYTFSGKEEQEELGLNWHDFYARNYDAVLGRWMNVDPLAEDYYEWSPYNYSYNNPIFFIDPTGMGPTSTDVIKNEDGTYKVVGGDLNDGDKGIYVVNENGERTGEKIGESLTMYSFYNADTQDPVDQQGWKGTIDPNSTESGDLVADFKSDVDGGEISLLEYMPNATDGKDYDFKRGGDATSNDREDHHRGSVFETKSDGTKVFASARDAGNFAAGYIAGNKGLPWKMAKGGFNALEFVKSGSLEGTQSTLAQQAGFSQGARGPNGVIGRAIRQKNYKDPIADSPRGE